MLGPGQFRVQVRFMGWMICPGVGEKRGLRVPRAGTANPSCEIHTRTVCTGQQDLPEGVFPRGWAACQRSLLREHQPHFFRHVLCPSPGPSLSSGLSPSPSATHHSSQHCRPLGPRMDVRHPSHAGQGHGAAHISGLPTPFLTPAACVGLVRASLRPRTPAPSTQGSPRP